MADRKQFLTNTAPNAELLRLISAVKDQVVSEEELQEQRISFAFGNALNRNFVTKESVRHTARNMRLRA